MYSKLFAFTFVALRVQAVAFGAPNIVNPPVLANLRIEGPDSTFFEGQVMTQGHDVMTASSNGSHHCDGTNNGASRVPGATCTTALADAAKQFNFTFDATFSPSLDDFFITNIYGVSSTSWGLAFNFRLSDVGGCQQKLISTTDEVLWAFNAFRKEHFLFLSSQGPATVPVNKPITVTVVDGASNLPISNATVNGILTDNFGNANLTFSTTGIKTIKADRADSIRSNALNITVTSAGDVNVNDPFLNHVQYIVA